MSGLKHDRTARVPARKKRRQKRLQKRADEIAKLTDSLADKIQRLIDANISIIASRYDPNLHESSAEWIGRNLGWIKPSVWKELQSSRAMKAAIQYRQDWIVQNGLTPKPRNPDMKKSLWAHVGKSPAMIRVKPVKQERCRQKMDSPGKDGSVWTCSGGLPSLGKRK
jgi:hypothetical protein